ncbi:MAG: IS3 family transposase, partial [Proteobacteria bacterium]|nr:IS3 family transposase [Pseudomonadota bacterium]
MIEAAEKLGKGIGVSAACRAMGVPRSNLYRARKPRKVTVSRTTPPRALKPEEKAQVRTVL